MLTTCQFPRSHIEDLRQLFVSSVGVLKHINKYVAAFTLGLTIPVDKAWAYGRGLYLVDRGSKHQILKFGDQKQGISNALVDRGQSYYSLH